MRRRKSTTISVRCAGWGTVLLASALVIGCQHPPDVVRADRRFDALLHPANAPAASTANQAWLTMGGESRAVIARPAPVVHAEGLRVEAAGVRSLRAYALDGLSEPLPAVEARVRPSGGEWQRRVASITQTKAGRSVNVTFVPADVMQPMDVAVTAWVPPLPLDVTTETFRVPARAQLRFATAVRSDLPAQAHFRVAVDSGDGKLEELWSSQGSDMTSAPEWQDVTLDMRPYAGRDVRLHFEAPVTSTVSLVDAPVEPPRVVISAPVLMAPRTEQAPVDNLIVVSIDTLRADHVGAYGYSRRITPTIDRLAAGGTVFERVFAVWPETSASHMTLFTSLYPTVHGIGISKWGGATLAPWQLTLAEWLRQQGFVTAAVTEDGLVAAAAGFPRGFDTYKELRGEPAANGPFGTNPIDGLPIGSPHVGAVKDGVSYATNWLRLHRSDRFFLFLHTYQVHQRLAPGAAYEGLRARLVHDGNRPEIADAKNYLATYDASIAYTDDVLATLVQALDELQLGRRTLLVVTSDHGEAFYEHGEFGHDHTLHDEELRVPLVLSCPGYIAAGKRSTTQIGLIDVLPTLLELLHVPPLPQAEGHSAAPLLHAADGPGTAPPLIGELGDERRSVRTDAWKLTRVEDKDGVALQFFDLRTDPGEQKPLAVEDRPEVAGAVRLLAQHQVDVQAWRTQLQQAAGGPETPLTRQLDAETRQRMRALGYDVPEN